MLYSRKKIHKIIYYKLRYHSGLQTPNLKIRIEIMALSVSLYGCDTWCLVLKKIAYIDLELLRKIF